tara:strand:+ start:579 stop:749 length:171 start_codon:yes stop_codon:yes gene_type:complete
LVFVKSFLNDSNLIFDTRRNDEIIIVITIIIGSIENDINGIPIKKTPFAGVGRPKK